MALAGVLDLAPLLLGGRRCPRRQVTTSTSLLTPAAAETACSRPVLVVWKR